MLFSEKKDLMSLKNRVSASHFTAKTIRRINTNLLSAMLNAKLMGMRALIEATIRAVAVS